MKTNIKRKLLSLLLAVVLVAVAPSVPFANVDTTSTLVANPSTQEIRFDQRISNKIDTPVYAITQPGAVNGSNYVKLRDIANVIDFGVEWNAAEPNAMRIYTNRHYDGTGVTTGTATEAKTAIPSTMSIYIDNVLVDAGDIKIYLIDNNNYFAIRDLAKLVNFECLYISNGNYVNISAKGCYRPDYMTPLVPRNIVYEDVIITFPRTYGKPSGEILATTHTVSPQDPMAREDYWNTYASAEAKAAFDRQLAKTSRLCYNVDEVNAIIQTLIDLPTQRAMESHVDDPLNYVPAHYFVQDRDKAVQGQDTALGWKHVPYFSNTTVNAGSGLTYFDARHFDTTAALAAAPEIAPMIAKLEGKTTREQALIIIQTICDKFQYGGNGPKPTSDASKVAAMWSDGKVYSTICSGYEDAMESLFNLAGIPYFLKVSDDHVWGEIYLVEEDKWVAVDATWADGGTPGGNFAKYAINDIEVHYMSVVKKPYPAFSDMSIVAREIMELGMQLRSK